MMSQRIRVGSHVQWACALFLGIIGFYTTAALWFPMAYIWGTYEDLFGEWIQFWSIVFAMVISVRLALVRWRYRWFFRLLALSCLYVALEEISYGQRLFGYTSPEYFRANNLQGETNVHNFLTGPYGTRLKDLLSYGLALALAVYGFLYPAMLRFRFRLARWFDRRGLAAPPFYLWPFFVAAAVFECSPFGFNEAEVAEILVGVGLVYMTVHYRFVYHSTDESSDLKHFPLSQNSLDKLSNVPDDPELPVVAFAAQHNPSDACDTKGRQGLPAINQRRWFGSDERIGSASCTELVGPLLRRRLSKATVWVLTLSVATTSLLLVIPSQRVRIQRRIDNGVKKFAGRYARHGQWSTALELYQRVHTKEPHRVSVLRDLAECAQHLGDDVRFDYYLQQARTIDLAKLKARPDSASAQRSLARTYRMMDDEESAQRQLHEALLVGLQRVRKWPDSAASAYSVGRTYLMMGRVGPALEQLSKAFALEPTSRKYRGAYYQARRSVQMR